MLNVAVVKKFILANYHQEKGLEVCIIIPKALWMFIITILYCLSSFLYLLPLIFVKFI